MDGIYTPPSLSAADATLIIATQLQKLNDPGERKKIEQDIKNAHALNEAEAKKHADALSLITKHQGVLDENNRVLAQIKAEQKKLDNDKAGFKSEMEAALIKIGEQKSQASSQMEEAAALLKKATESHNNIALREDDLKRSQDAHSKKERELAEREADLEREETKLKEFRESILKLDKQTNEKIEALKKFNF